MDEYRRLHRFAMQCYRGLGIVLGWAERGAVLRLLRPSPAKILLLLAAVAGGYFFFSGSADRLLSHNLSHEEQQVRDQIEELDEQKQDLEALRDYLQTNEYVEGVARKVLGVVRAGERLYVVESDAAPTPEGTPAESSDDKETWWERLYKP